MIVDDHEVVRDGLKSLLSREGFNPVASCDSGKSALRFLESPVMEIDLILMDIRMDDGDGFQVLEWLRSRQSPISVVLMTAFENVTYLARGVALGAREVVPKGIKMGELTRVLNSAVGKAPPLVGTRFAALRAQMHSLVERRSLPEEMPLTEREGQVLRHIALGLSNKEIASSLTISIETVKEHVQNVLRKMEANDRTDAAVRAVRAGVV